GSNPRPTAWKAVTLPLSYSRLRTRCPVHSPCSAPPAQTARVHRRRLAGLPSRSPLRSSERRLVAREGLEPSKPLGRQIYILLRLTASLPRRCSVVWKRVFRSYPRPWSCLGRWSWRRDLNPRPADYKSAALPD